MRGGTLGCKSELQRRSVTRQDTIARVDDGTYDADRVYKNQRHEMRAGTKGKASHFTTDSFPTALAKSCSREP